MDLIANGRDLEVAAVFGGGKMVDQMLAKVQAHYSNGNRLANAGMAAVGFQKGIFEKIKR
jgi:hypothetical protein